MSEGPLSGSVNPEGDHRPELSPYTSEIWMLYFQTSDPLYVPYRLLSQSSSVDLLTQASRDSGCTLHFNDISPEVGHTLAHFLFTGGYECLKPKGESHAERTAVEIATAFGVYAAAESWKLPTLCNLAAEEMIRLGDQLSFPSIIDTLDRTNSTVISSPRVAMYLTSRIESDCENSATADQILAEIGTPNTISKFLLKYIFEISSRSWSWKKPPPLNGVSVQNPSQLEDGVLAEYSTKKPDMLPEDPDSESILEDGNIEGSMSQSEEYTLEPGEKTPLSEHVVLQDKSGEETPPGIKTEPPGSVLEVRDAEEYRKLAQLSSPSRVIGEFDTASAREVSVVDSDQPVPTKPLSTKEKKKLKKVKRKKEVNASELS